MAMRRMLERPTATEIARQPTSPASDGSRLLKNTGLGTSTPAGEHSRGWQGVGNCPGNEVSQLRVIRVVPSAEDIELLWHAACSLTEAGRDLAASPPQPERVTRGASPTIERNSEG